MPTKHKKRNCPSVDELKAAAFGQWIEILGAAGIPSHVLDGRGHPCPGCRDGKNRFAAFRDVRLRGAVHCRHCFTSGSCIRPGDGIATLQWFLEIDFLAACRWLADWLGMLDQSPQVALKPKEIVSILKIGAAQPRVSSSQQSDIMNVALESHVRMTPRGWQTFSDHLGLPIECLKLLRVGWSSRHQAMTWPMEDAMGNIVGVRLRSLADDRKWAVSGGFAGVFVPTGMTAPLDRLYVAEGPTDTASLLSLGLRAIGRSSASGSLDIEMRKVRCLLVSECVILSDRDDVGIASANRLADALVTVCRSVCVLVPPDGFKDAREWVQSGISKEAIGDAADRVPARSLAISSEVTL